MGTIRVHINDGNPLAEEDQKAKDASNAQYKKGASKIEESQWLLFRLQHSTGVTSISLYDVFLPEESKQSGFTHQL